MNEQKLKEQIQQKYNEIVSQKENISCCGTEVCMSETYYSTFEGYEAEADLGLGCGLPMQFAGIKKGDHVLDLGSGAGNDCFIAREKVGEKGRVIGIDFSEAMIEKAEHITKKKEYKNVFFRKSDIEELPVGGNSKDVVISDCVLNLLPIKDKVFHEIYRVLKPGGHFCISDIVLNRELPEKIKNTVEMYTGCIAGAIKKNEYIIHLFSAGFIDLKIETEKIINLPDSILEEYLDQEEIIQMKKDTPISSITITGTKPVTVCCSGSGCC